MKTINRISSDGRSVTLCRMASASNPKTLEVSVSHNKGGINYFTGNRVTAGNRISFHVVDVKEHDNGFTSVSFTMFDEANYPGLSFVMDDCERFSKKKMLELASNKKVIAETLEKFCVRFGLVNDWQ